MKILKVNWLWSRGFSFWPFAILVKSRDYRDYDKLVNHEKIHWRQQSEFWLFYIWYGIEWFVNLFKYGKKAYIKISFEQEAYDNDQNLLYLRQRKPYAWWKYLKYKPIK